MEIQKKITPITICIDFDGTCVTHNFPEMGKDIGAIPVLKELVNKGHHLILYTMRSDETLNDAVNWFNVHNIPLYGINENKTQNTWTSSQKVYANLYIDDATLGCPLIQHNIEDRPYIDWIKVREYLENNGII